MKIRKRRKTHRQLNLNWVKAIAAAIPTPTLVLSVFALISFYTAQGLIGMVVTWGLLLSAMCYFNAAWFGDARTLRLATANVDADTHLLILVSQPSTPVQTELDRLKQRCQLTVVDQELTKLAADNGTYDTVVVNYGFSQLRPRLTKQKAMKEAARVVAPGGQLWVIDRGFNSDQYRIFLRRSGFRNVKSLSNGVAGWWSGPWRPSFRIGGQKW